MQTVREQAPVRLSNSGFKSTPSQFRISENQVNKLKIREFISWSVCFAVIVVLTGLLKYLKVGITMESVTSALFYSSLLALAYFIYRIVSLSRNPAQIKSNPFHELN
jgi:hypothetical protein